MTGGLGPTTDDITREITAEFLGLELQHDAGCHGRDHCPSCASGIQTDGSNVAASRRAQGATVLPNENGSAPGLYLAAKTAPGKKSPHLFLLPGPPRELQPMFQEFGRCRSSVKLFRKNLPSIAGPIASPGWANPSWKRRSGSVCSQSWTLSSVIARALEKSICGSSVNRSALDQAEAIITSGAGCVDFLQRRREAWKKSSCKLLTERRQTLAVAESCTGGFLAHRITNVPGASAVFLAGYVTYANEAKEQMLGVDPRLIAAARSGERRAWRRRWRKARGGGRTRLSPWPRPESRDPAAARKRSRLGPSSSRWLPPMALRRRSNGFNFLTTGRHSRS